MMTCDYHLNILVCIKYLIGQLIYTVNTQSVLKFVNDNVMTDSLTDYERYRGGVIERREWHGQAITIGVRYRFTEK